MSRSIPHVAECVNLIPSASQSAAQLPLFPGDAVGVPVTRGSKNPLWLGLADRLRRLRLQADVSALTLSALAGISDKTSTRIERGVGLPGIDVIEKIALALGVEPCWLGFGNDGEEPFQQKIPRLVSGPELPRPSITDRVNAQAFLGCGERLRVARLAKGLSMRDVARAAEVSVQAVSAMEAGRICPRVDTCERLAVALDVAPCWLAYGVGRGPIAN